MRTATLISGFNPVSSRIFHRHDPEGVWNDLTITIDAVNSLLM